MKCGSTDGRGNGDNSGVDFVEISTIFAIQNAFLFKMTSFDVVSGAVL